MFKMVSVALMAVLAAACSNADGSVSPICGTVETVSHSANSFIFGGKPVVDSTAFTTIKFVDGRELKLHGLPQIDMIKGKTFSFPVGDREVRGSYSLTGRVTEAGPGCTSVVPPQLPAGVSSDSTV